MKTFRFNPGFQTDDQAVANFVVRQHEFHRVLEGLTSSEGSEHRILIVAPRGAGKTTLLRRVLAEMRNNLFLQQTWLPIYLGEESYAATTPGEFLLECLYHLSQDNTDHTLILKHRRATQLSGELELREYCLKIFQALSTQSGKRFLIMVENFHILLNDQIGKNVRDLLNILSRENLFGVLATSVKSIRNQDEKNIYDLFKYIYLKPLTLSDCHKLWQALTKRDVEPSRIRPLQILTGGSPRLLHILADFMKTPSLHDLMENLSFLIDENTEYFKSQLDNLPSQERKVFVALLDAWDPSSAKQIAESARVSINNASAMLNRLADRGAVIKQPGSGRIVLYHAAERLFNIYYLMRRRSHPSSRVRALVAFMTQYYDRKELVDTTALLAQEACSFDPSRRSDYHNAFNAILKNQPESIRSEILERTPPDFLASLRTDPTVEQYTSAQRARSDDNELEEWLARARELIDDGKIDDGKDLLRKAIDLKPGDFRPWISLAFADQEFGSPDTAIENAREAVALAGQNPFPHLVLGMLLRQNYRTQEAEGEFSSALKIDPDMSLALTELAQMKFDARKPIEAMQLFRRAYKQGPLFGSGASRFAFLLSQDGDHKEAERVLRVALKEDKDDDESRHALASLLNKRGRDKEAIELLRNAAEESREEERWHNYASFLLMVCGDPERAVKAIENALTRGVEGTSLYTLLAQAKKTAGASADEISEVAGRPALNREESEQTLVAQARILQMAGDLREAEAAFSKASSLPNASNYPSLLLGRLLSNIPGRSLDAAKALEKAALGDGSRHCGPLKELAELRVHQGNDSEATALLERVLKLNPTCECGLVLRAEIAGRNGDRLTARQLCSRALELSPSNVAALTVLARNSDDEDAKKLIEHAVSIEPSDPQVLLTRSRLPGRELADRIADAKDALSEDARLAEAHIELALLYARSGNKDGAISQLADALKTVPMRMEAIPAFVDCTVQLISYGYLAELLNLLTSEIAAPVEPLAVAVQKFAGKRPVVAKEVEEVANDILAKIKSPAHIGNAEPDLLSG